MINAQTVSWAGIAAGAAIGIGVGATAMGLLGHTQAKADGNAAAREEAKVLKEQRANVQAELDAGLETGKISVREQRELERQLRELDTQLEQRDLGSQLLSENWPLLPGIAGAGVGAIVAGKLDDSMNWSYKRVMVRAGSTFDIAGAPFGRGPKYAMVKDVPIGRSFMPSMVAGVAGGLLAGMIGARIVQQFVNQPSS